MSSGAAEVLRDASDYYLQLHKRMLHQWIDASYGMNPNGRRSVVSQERMSDFVSASLKPYKSFVKSASTAAEQLADIQASAATASSEEDLRTVPRQVQNAVLQLWRDALNSQVEALQAWGQASLAVFDEFLQRAKKEISDQLPGSEG